MSIGDAVVSAGVLMNKALLQFADVVVEASSDDSLARTLTAEVARVGGSDVVGGGSATPAPEAVPGKRQVLRWALRGKPHSQLALLYPSGRGRPR